MYKALILNKIIQGLILFLGVVILLFNLVYFTREATKVVSYKKSGTIVTETSTVGDSVEVIRLLDTADFLGPVYPAIGDTVITVNDTSVIVQEDSVTVINRWNTNFYAPLEPGRIVPIEFLHEGRVFRAEVMTRIPSADTFFNILALQIVRFLLSISFVAVGLWAFLKRGGSGGVRALVMFCYAMSAFFVFAVWVLSSRYSSFEIPIHNVFSNIFNYIIPFFGAFWLNLQLLFPRPKRFIKEKPVLAYSVCYTPMILILILDYLGVESLNYVASLIILPGQVFAGFFILGYSYNKAADSLEKRQTHLVLWGSGLGLAPLFILLLVAAIFGDWFARWKWQMLYINLSFVTMLLTPLSFIYAFQRYRLLEVEGKLKRGTRYVLATGALLALFVGFIYIVGELMLRQLGISSRTPTLIASLALAIGLSPAIRKIRGRVERKFYPERHKLREMSRDFIQQALYMPDGKTLWGKVESQLRETLKVEKVYPILLDQGREGFVMYNNASIRTPFKLGQGFAEKLLADRRPILVDEAVVSDEVVLSLEEELWLARFKIALVLPLIAQSELVGFLGLGFKTGRDDYSPEELQILSALASQLALAGENIRLLEENIEKKRMEEELAIARKIQQGFLPGVIPNVPGLEIAAKSDFCLEVAGDYYDVLALEGYGTVLAVGDVAGKGAGAALLMANLQASLRTAMGIGASLGKVVARINSLIFQNTSPEQYITFFVGLFDPKKLTLTYVNAGHNYPMLLRKNKETILLDKGGLILGCMPEVKYEQETVSLKPGEMLLMYTDGVSEAMNSAEEEFGEERLEKLFRKNFNLTVEDSLSELEGEIHRFRGEVPLMDDFTLLLARVK